MNFRKFGELLIDNAEPSYMEGVETIHGRPKFVINMVKT